MIKDRNLLSTSKIAKLIKSEIKNHGTPLMLISKSILTNQYNLFHKYLPNVEPYYAIKANPFPAIIKHFADLGCGFDVASANEMKTVLSLKVKPEKIIFANTIKSEKDIAFACDNGVHLMTFDSEPELYKIAKSCPQAKVLVRIKVANVGSMVELSLKFGADPEQAVPFLLKAKKLGLKPVGVAFHVGSQCLDATNYIQALEMSSAIFKEAKQKGLELNMLDIGGGFPIKHFDKEKHISFVTIATKINKEINRLFDKNVKIIAEPGRFFVGPAGILITKVVGRTFRNNKNYYYLDDGLYQDFSGIVFDHCKYQFNTLKRGQKFLSTLAGPTCDSFDTISQSEELPELDVGDIIYVKNIGAYSSASAVQNFNGFNPAKIVVVE